MSVEGNIVTPSEPQDVPCEWCGRPSAYLFPLPKRKALFMYVCGRHRKHGELAVGDDG